MSMIGYQALVKKYPAIELSDFIELFAINAELYISDELNEPVSRDPNDDKLIACALSARVKIIVLFLTRPRR